MVMLPMANTALTMAISNHKELVDHICLVLLVTGGPVSPFCLYILPSLHAKERYLFIGLSGFHFSPFLRKEILVAIQQESKGSPVHRLMKPLRLHGEAA